MKKFYLLLCILLIPTLGTKAQNFAPIGATWHYTETFFGNGNIDYLKLEAAKDTLINNQICRKLEKRHALIPQYQFWKDIYVFERNDSVFFYDHQQQIFQMIYDFSASTGDSWIWTLMPDPNFTSSTVVDSMKLLVDSMSTVLINGQLKNKLFVYYLRKDMQNSAPIYVVEDQSEIIEGIGDVKYFLNFIPYQGGVVIDANFSAGLRCYQDTILGMHHAQTQYPCSFTTGLEKQNALQTEFNIYPNPFNNELFIEDQNKQIDHFQVINAQGKIWYESDKFDNTIHLPEMPTGVYFFLSFDQTQKVLYRKQLIKE